MQLFRITASVALIAICGWMAPTFAVNLLSNGDFAKADAKQQPAVWTFGADKHVNAKMTVVPNGGHERDNALHVQDKSSYGAAWAPLRQFLPLAPGRKYEISCWSKGNAGGYLSFALGKDWRARIWIRGGEDWFRYAGTFDCNANEFSWSGAYEICLLAEDQCDALVSDVTLTPLNALVNLSGSASRSDRLCIIPKAVFDKDARSIPSTLPLFRPGLIDKPGIGLGKDSVVKSLKDLSAEAALAYDDKGLIFYARVHDNKHFSNPGENMWNGDCIQIAIDQQADRHADRIASDCELGFSLYDGKPDSFCWTANRALTSQELEYNVTPLPDGYFVAARLGWNYLNKIDVKGTGAFSFNMVVNDSDDGVNRKAVSLAAGIYNGAKDNKNNTLCLLSGRTAPVFFLPENNVLTDELNALLTVTDAVDYRLEITMPDGSVKKVELPYDTKPVAGTPAVAKIRVDSTSFSAGAITARIVSGNIVKAEAKLEKKDFFNKFGIKFAEIKKRYAALQAEIKKMPHPSARLLAEAQIAERQLSLLEKDVREASNQERKDYYGERGLRICAELDDLLTLMDKDLTAVPQTEYRYVSSPKTLKDGYFSATMANGNGKKQERPLVFAGYGHFSQAVRDIEWFPGIDGNAIQTEAGPAWTITGEKPDGTFTFDEDILRQLSHNVKRAWDNNMTIFFLMSPHYYPEWALTNHPEAAWNSGSFLRFDVQHPYSRKLLEAYYRKVITTLRNSPGAGAIHSICISNEPQYRPSLRRPFTRDRFISYLKRHYGEVAKLNAAYGSNYGSFAAAAPSVDPTFDTKPKGLYYDFLSFRQDEFADWHTWMASLVKELWPGMAVHCKQLGGFGLEFSTDFERFSKFSTVHGTDTGIVFGGDESGISRGDYCDALMTSFSPVHIVNSETHLSPDRYEKPIPYNIFYTCLFQQFMLGVGGATVWVWEDYGYDLFKERHDFVGSIYRRPMGILAIRDATADANRLIYEIRDTFNVKPEIAILYSMPSKIYRSEYENDAAAVWNAFNYTGRKVGFISEAQLQAGQLGATKIIVAPGTANVMPATAQALTKFTAKGGKIVKLGDCFAWNQYGRALTESVPAAKLDVALLKQPNQLAVELAKVADTVLGPLPVQVFAPGVEWRCTPMKDGFSLVYLVNWSSKPLPVKLSAVGTDLISGHSMPKTFELPSLKPVLLKIKH